ncbi:MAG TPA: AraC family transcriptional regulator [Polyangiaceae bacterium]|jgi:AraC-like DNA-binding protein|nr:AraC family transcriptional regulator [Polyangiaceae bacterium]
MAARRAETGKSEASAEAHTIPGVHAGHIAELMGRWGTTAEELLGPLGLSAAALAEPSSRISIEALQRVVDRARMLTGEQGLGYYLGLQMRISAHGYLGFAAMTASTLREALELASRFAPTRTTAIDLRLEEHDEHAYLVIEENCELGSARDVVIIGLMIGIWRIGNSLTGKELEGDAELAFPEPSYAADLARKVPGKLRFGQPSHRIVFERKVLDLPPTMADPDALRVAREQCEKELDRLGYQQSLLTRVRAVLGARERALPTLEQVAVELGTSARTLKRKLADEGTAYSILVDEVQAARAVSLMRSELSVDEIADRLGYSDAANFTRAFRRWTGKTPRAFRKG